MTDIAKITIEKWTEITSKLLKFGEYSNVGGGRTSGLGVVGLEKLVRVD